MSDDLFGWISLLRYSSPLPCPVRTLTSSLSTGPIEGGQVITDHADPQCWCDTWVPLPSGDGNPKVFALNVYEELLQLAFCGVLFNSRLNDAAKFLKVLALFLRVRYASPRPR